MAKKRNLELNTQLGLLVLIDVASFSTRSMDDQKAIVKNLWRILGGIPFTTKPKVLYNGTGDGALIAFQSFGPDDFEKALKACDRLHEKMGQGKVPCKLRIAIHIGAFHSVKVECGEFRSVEVVGKAPNQIARMVGYADSGETVVSENFVQAWKTQRGPDVLKRLYPPSEHPHIVAVKHDEPLAIRIFASQESKSPQIRKIYVLDRLIRDQLRAIDECFCAAVAECYGMADSPAPTLAEIDARISIFIPVSGDTVLRCTKYRHHHLNQSVGMSDTKYVYNKELKKCHGPLAKAFVAANCHFVTALPSYLDDPKAYVAQLRKEGVPAEVIEQFGRHARAFFAVPCGLPDHIPDVVVCVDTMHPFADLHDDDLAAACSTVREEFGHLLSLLWRNRY